MATKLVTELLIKEYDTWLVKIAIDTELQLSGFRVHVQDNYLTFTSQSGTVVEFERYRRLAPYFDKPDNNFYLGPIMKSTFDYQDFKQLLQQIVPGNRWRVIANKLQQWAADYQRLLLPRQHLDNYWRTCR